MFPLDPKTVRRLAEIIVDDGGYDRRGWQLTSLLAHSGWTDPPEFDGWSRVAWLEEQMLARQNDRVAIERLMCRVCDPLEYDTGMADADAFRQVINEKLTPEQLVISYVGGRPVVGELRPDVANPWFTEPPELERRIRALVTNAEAADLLTRRLRETRICERGGAYTMAIIGIGSLVEGVLWALLVEHDENARLHRFVDRNGKESRSDRPSLDTLIHTAHARGWIQLDARNFMTSVKDFRNFVHPRAELAEQPDFDADSVQLCWSPVQTMLNDLETQFGL